MDHGWIKAYNGAGLPEKISDKVSIYLEGITDKTKNYRREKREVCLLVFLKSENNIIRMTLCLERGPAYRK